LPDNQIGEKKMKKYERQLDRKGISEELASKTYPPFVATGRIENLFNRIEAEVPFGNILEHLTDNYDAEGYATPGIEYVLETLEWMARKKSLHFDALDNREGAGFWNDVANSLAKAFEEIVENANGSTVPIHHNGNL
jgi:hypothetical protein